MAIIITVGLPSAGKSIFVDELAKYFPCEVIRPQVVDGYIESWYDTLNSATRLAFQRSSKNVVIDTCGATPANFNEIFTMAALRNIDVIVLYIHSSAQECINRWGEGGDLVIAKYVVRIKKAVREYQSKYKVIAVNNTGTIEDLKNQAPEVANTIGTSINNSNSSTTKSET